MKFDIVVVNPPFSKAKNNNNKKVRKMAKTKKSWIHPCFLTKEEATPENRYLNYKNIRENIKKVIRDKHNKNSAKVSEFGEVYTPFPLIEKMMNALPKELWSDPTKTMLDPCAGVGNFMCVIVEKLMEGLKDWEPDEEKRYKHIIENQIHQIEIQPRSVVWIRKLYNPDKKYKMHLVCADILNKNHIGWRKVGYMWNEIEARINRFKYF